MLAMLSERPSDARRLRAFAHTASERMDIRAMGAVERIVHPDAAYGVTIGDTLIIRARFQADDLCPAAAMFGGEPGRTYAATLAGPRSVVAAAIGRLRWRGSEDLRDGTAADLDEDDACYPLIILDGERLAGFELFLLNATGAVLAVRPSGCGNAGCPTFQLGQIDETGRFSIGATGTLHAEQSVGPVRRPLQTA